MAIDDADREWAKRLKEHLRMGSMDGGIGIGAGGKGFVYDFTHRLTEGVFEFEGRAVEIRHTGMPVAGPAT